MFKNRHGIRKPSQPLNAYSKCNRSGAAVGDWYSDAESLSGQGRDESDSAISNSIPQPDLRPLNGYFKILSYLTARMQSPENVSTCG